MQIMYLDHIGVTYGGRTIFTNLTWAIDSRSCSGLVGPNGSGKSSLLKIIGRLQEPESGTVQRTGKITIGYLPQEVNFEPGMTLIETAMLLPPELAELEAKLAQMEQQIGDPAIYEDMDKLTRALDKQQVLIDQYEELGGSSHASRVREILSRLGIQSEQYDLPAETLSGGQKKLVLLTQLAAAQPTVLLLDEPDNHLDLLAKRQLEKFIQAYDGAVVIVSHDRYLLDEVAQEIVELENGQLTVYKGNYSAYAAERELKRMRQQQQYVTQQKEIARIEAAIKRFELWAERTEDPRHFRQARSRRKMLERMEEKGEMIDRVQEQRRMGLELNGWRGSTKALEAKNIAMGFDDDLLFVDLSFIIQHGERVGLIGPNGSGKSVLLRTLLDEVNPLEGEVVIGPSITTGYYAQEHQTLSKWLDRSPLELIRDVAPRSEGGAVTFLLKFLFTYEQVRQPIRTLSGGERSRLQLAALMLSHPNLLLFDEPTNNLDIPSAEVLEHVLEDFEGAMLVISHDRYFLDRVVDRLFILDGGELKTFEGNYTDYLEALEN